MQTRIGFGLAPDVRNGYPKELERTLHVGFLMLRSFGFGKRKQDGSDLVGNHGFCSTTAYEPSLLTLIFGIKWFITKAS